MLALLQTEFAAVLLDVKMPDMTGYELARLILGRKLNRHLPIIFVSSHRTDGTDVMLGYEAGAVDYITKPFDPPVLRSKVGVFAQLYRHGLRAGLGGGGAARTERKAAADSPVPDRHDRPPQLKLM